jgi:acetoin utilization protein AcuB
MKRTIEGFMTPVVHTISARRTLAEAHTLMRANAIRHLPVMHGGDLVGIVTQRDLHLVETFKDVDATKVLVEDAMSQDVFTVSPDTPLSEVCTEMAAHKYGSAVVVRAGEVVGIFTTVDALKALALDVPPTGGQKRAPRKHAPAR